MRSIGLYGGNILRDFVSKETARKVGWCTTERDVMAVPLDAKLLIVRPFGLWYSYLLKEPFS